MIFPRGNPRKLALCVLGTGLALTAAGCGGSPRGSHPRLRAVLGNGYVVGVPKGWQVRRVARGFEARQQDELVAVTRFALARRFEPSLWRAAVRELDLRARELADQEGGARLTSAATQEISGRRGRVYELDNRGVRERIGFVLVGRREYELYCRNAADACDSLFKTFVLSPEGI